VKSFWVILSLLPAACATSGNAWMHESSAQGNGVSWDPPKHALYDDPQPNTYELPVKSRTLGRKPVFREPATREAPTDEPTPHLVETGTARPPRRNRPQGALTGKVLGTFRNTYYDFPSETDFNGPLVTLHNAQCKPLAQVPRPFFEALCVQGSGLLSSGNAVSFNRRDCECAELCPKTQQRICFDALELTKFPWGRGATGQPITPLVTVAVDSDLIALGTSIYIPEFEGLPRDAARTSLHDGCFVAQDRGLKVKGQHVDVFTGQRATTQLWNALVPSNSGVTVVLDSPKCGSTP
jgi:3D (Asp-Asp-Asp) domain-containing protein